MAKHELTTTKPVAARPSLPLVSDVPYGTVGRIYAADGAPSPYNGVLVMKLYSGNMVNLKDGATWDNESSKFYHIDVLPVGSTVTLKIGN